MVIFSPSFATSSAYPFISVLFSLIPPWIRLTRASVFLIHYRERRYCYVPNYMCDVLNALCSDRILRNHLISIVVLDGLKHVAHINIIVHGFVNLFPVVLRAICIHFGDVAEREHDNL